MRKSLPGNAAPFSTSQFHGFDYVKITIFGFALTALWQSLHSIILPLRLLDFVAESEKNTYLGLLTFTGLILAMAVQPIAGTISDRSGFSWGRRRPYILLGTAAAILLIPGIGLMGSYAAIFIIYCLLQVSSNTAQGAYQAFIPELVPKERWGLASGVKSLLEILGGATLLLFVIAPLMDNYFTGGEDLWLWLALLSLAIVLLATMVATVVLVKEPPAPKQSGKALFGQLYKTFQISIKANPDFTWFLVSRMIIFMAFATIQQFAAYFLIDVVGVTSPAEATARFSAIAVVGMLVVVWPAGHWSDKIGRRPIGVMAGLLGAFAIVLIFLFPSYTSVLIAAGILGVAIGAFTSTNWALATDLVAKGEEARYLGLANVATAGGAALARLIGPVIDLFNTQSTGLGYQVMLGACFIYFIAGAILLLNVRKSS